MVAPGSTRQEIDLSTRIPSFPGVFGGVNFPAKRGLVNQFTLATSDSQFLGNYTPTGRVEVGYDLGYFSGLAFLQQSNTLWVNRVVGAGALYAGGLVKSSATVSGNAPLSAGLADPTAFVFNSPPDVATPAVAQVVTAQAVADVAGSLNSTYFLISSKTVNYYVWYNVNGAGVDPALAGKTGIMVAVATGASANTVATATAAAVTAYLAGAVFTSPAPGAATATITNVVAGTALLAASAGTSGFTVLTSITGANAVTEIDQVILLYASSQGDWASAGSAAVSWQLTNYATNPDKVKVPGAFLIEVFTAANLAIPAETFTCSRVLGARDGYGNNIFVEDQLQSSQYLRAINNPAIASTVLPDDQLTPLAIFGGADGAAVLDSEMVTGLQVFSNPDDLPLTVLMDCGRATATYGQACDALVQSRGDCVSCLSTPFAAEASVTYVTDLITYRKTTLNLNSSWSALYTPHVKIFDKFNNRNIFVSPDGYAAAAISFSAANFEIWFPPAGFKRGKVQVLDLRRRFKTGEISTLYDAGINCLRFVPGKGIVIWGQKTLSAVPSALDRLNVRLMLIVVEPATAAALENFTFEFNDAASRNLLLSQVTGFMDGIKARRGVVDYLAVCDTSNNTTTVIDANEMILDLYVKPSKSAEFMKLRTIITSQGLSFQQAASLF